MHHSDETYLYYNLTYVNTDSRAQPASSSETRSVAILKNPSEWKMSVIRFDIDTHTIPINILIMQLGSLTATTSYITLKYLGNYYTENIVYVEESLRPFPFKSPAVYSYQRFLDFINTAVKAAFVRTWAVGYPPQYIFNPLTNLIDIYVDSNFLPSAGANQIEIIVNNPLYLYLTNFDYSFDSEPGGNPLYLNVLKIDDVNTSQIPAFGSRVGYPLSIANINTQFYKISQFAQGMASWNSLRSIVLSSDSIPCPKEAITANPENSANYSTDSTFSIVSDFLVPIENQITNGRVIAEYLPSAQYRYLNLISTDPLYIVSFKVYWTDFLGNIYPVYLYPSNGMSIKILFQKK
jgi:hypothetical protein